MNLFAATCHVNYAKNSRLYLQLMRELPNNFPWLYQCFMTQRFHTVRRSSRLWARLWSLQWIYSLYKCAEVHDAMTKITNLKHRISEQHIELGASRSKRDFDDLTKIQESFHQHEPFNLNEKKSSGLTTSKGDSVNCDKTEQIGANIHEQLNKLSFKEAIIKKSH